MKREKKKENNINNRLKLLFFIYLKIKNNKNIKKCNINDFNKKNFLYKLKLFKIRNQFFINICKFKFKMLEIINKLHNLLILLDF